MEYAGDSKVGLVRSINQDSILLVNQGEISLFAVADGMGGHADGEKASRAITLALQNWIDHLVLEYYEDNFLKLVDSIRNCMEEVNLAIYKEYENQSVCGSTVSILLIYKDSYAIFQVGDSRIYKFEKRHLKQMTVDEVWENDIRTRRKFTEVEIDNSSKKGKLINALGTTPDLMMTIQTDHLSKKQIFLICSDGLYKMVSDKELTMSLKKVSRGANIQLVLDELMTKVHKAGARDNVSIILAKV